MRDLSQALKWDSPGHGRGRREEGRQHSEERELLESRQREKKVSGLFYERVVWFAKIIDKVNFKLEMSVKANLVRP